MDVQKQSDKILDQIKKATFFGMGVAAISYDKLRQSIDDMVNRGEMTTDEGRKTYEEITSRAEEEGRSMNERIRNQVRDILKDMGLADRAQIAMLESRIEALERRIIDLSTEQSKQKSETTEG